MRILSWEIDGQEVAAIQQFAYNPSQARDSHGRWTSGGAGGAVGEDITDNVHGRPVVGFDSPADFIANVTDEQLSEMYSVPAFGINARAHRTAVSSNGSMSVHVELYDDSGFFNVGTLDRHFYPDGHVKHELFELYDRKGEGIAAHMNAHAEDAYRAAGFSSITLDAGLSVGRYAWARQGYNYADNRYGDASRNMHRYSVERQMRNAYPDMDHAKIEGIAERLVPPRANAWDVAALEDHQRYLHRDEYMRLGKAAMLDGDIWRGVKSLDPASESHRIGEAYFKSKGAR